MNNNLLHTYRNDNSNVAYPFYGMEELPFSLNCIRGLSVGIVTGLPEDLYNIVLPLYVSTVSVTDDKVTISLCDSTDHLLCVVSNSEIAIMDPLLYYNGSPAITANLFTGTYTKNDIGTYTGKFWLDPSCVNIMPMNAYGKYDTMTINYKEEYKIGRALTINTSGFINSRPYNGRVDLVTTPDSINVPLINNLVTYKDHPMVDTINSFNMRTTTPGSNEFSALAITIDEDLVDKIVPKVDSEYYRSFNVIKLVVTGTTKYPSCYPADLDEAGDGGEDE